MYGYIAKIKAKPGERDALLAILLEGSSGMAGCINYVIAEDRDNADAIWVTEVWRARPRTRLRCRSQASRRRSPRRCP